MNKNVASIIARKRDGHALEPETIAELVRRFTAGDVPDYQMSAWAMAVCLRGMTLDETAALTDAMLHSGRTLEATDIARRVDKHSTGGLGDKSSLILAPLLACCGLEVPMLAGRALGSTGGTLDKLEAIPGYRTDLSPTEIQAALASVGCVITGATEDLVPADRKLYPLRGVTATVESIPLITASILSKKLAESLSALVLDVKFGSGAFMKTLPDARALGQSMIEVGSRMGLPITVLLTSMDQPNGRMSGNSVEVDESLEVLAGAGPTDLQTLTLALAGEVLLMKKLANDSAEAERILRGHLESGRAMERFRRMVAVQGGNLDVPRPRGTEWCWHSERDGYVAAIDTERLGLTLIEMGAGRKRGGDTIDHGVGLEMLVRLGDFVERGQPLVRVFAGEQQRQQGWPYLADAIELGDQPRDLSPLIADVIRPTALGSRSTQRVSASQRQSVIAQAIAVRERAHAPYSHFCVGAALLGESGKIHAGTNVENASYGLTICAERAAYLSAVAAGEKRFTLLAVATVGGAAPCGACRQFAAEFSEELDIVLIDVRDPTAIQETTLASLLPMQFRL